jgi:hypothetical protein
MTGIDLGKTGMAAAGGAEVLTGSAKADVSTTLRATKVERLDLPADWEIDAPLPADIAAA